MMGKFKRMNRVLVSAVLLAAAISKMLGGMPLPEATVWAESTPEVDAPAKVSTPPVLDGKLDDAVWSQALVLGPFREHMGRDAQITAQTFVKLLWDDTNLYVGFDCLEPNTANMVAPDRPRDGDIFGDDEVEIMINSRPNRRDYVYYHFAVSASGVMYDSRCTANGIDKTWDAPWQAKVSRGSDRWQAEFVIPQSTLGVAQVAYWSLNFCRAKAKPMEYSCWSPTFGPFHTMPRFGKVKGIRSSIFGFQTIEEFGPAALTFGSNAIPVRVMNRAVEPRNVRVEIDTKQPDGSTQLQKQTVALAGNTEQRVEVRAEIKQPGVYTMWAKLIDDQNRLLATERLISEFAPLRITPAGRGFWIGQEIPLQITLSTAPDDLGKARLKWAIKPWSGWAESLESPPARTGEFSPRQAQTWQSIKIQEFPQGVFELSVELWMDSVRIDRRSVIVELTNPF